MTTVAKAPDCWTDGTSVLLKGFWKWDPDKWGAVGFTGRKGESYRSRLRSELTDPFICVAYVTLSTDIGSEQRGKIAGFFLVSREEGDRDEFTHPYYHDLRPEKWRYSLRAVRAFTYDRRHRLSLEEFDPTALNRALPIAVWGEEIADSVKVRRLREIPFVEVDIYSGS